MGDEGTHGNETSLGAFPGVRVTSWVMPAVVVTLLLVGGTVSLWLVAGPPDAEARDGEGQASALLAPSAASSSHPGSREGEAATLALVQEWNTRRAEAWARHDVQALADLYAPGARVGKRDADLLRAWVERGWHVEGLAPHVLAVESRRRTSERWVVDLRERLPGTVARRGAERTALPAGGVSDRRVTYVRAGDFWVVAEVEELSEAVESG